MLNANGGLPGASGIGVEPWSTSIVDKDSAYYHAKCQPSVVSVQQKAYRAPSWLAVTSGAWYQFVSTEDWGVWFGVGTLLRFRYHQEKWEVRYMTDHKDIAAGPTRHPYLKPPNDSEISIIMLIQTLTRIEGQVETSSMPLAYPELGLFDNVALRYDPAVGSVYDDRGQVVGTVSALNPQARKAIPRALVGLRRTGRQLGGRIVHSRRGVDPRV